MRIMVGRTAFVMWNEWFSVNTLQQPLAHLSATSIFVVAVTTWQQTLLSTVEGEVVALLCAMEDACARGFVQVQFESDSLLLIDAIRLKQRGNSECSSIVANIIHIMSSFENFE
ncbi:hypothetical protein A2U01_0035613, partial [Trifolium medium]|nr:hypothetical protein [Trifolium medium]